MGLHLKISTYDDNGKPYEFEVVLTGMKTVEFPDYDIDLIRAEREIGFEVDSPELTFFDEYSSRGFSELILKIPDDVFSALEDQGYDSIMVPGFSRQALLDMLLETIEENESGAVEETLSILDPYVGTTKDGASIDREVFIQALINGLKEIADPETNSEQYMGDLNLYLYALTNLLDRSEFKIIETKPYYEESEYGIISVFVTCEIVIHEESIIEWTESMEFVIDDPIHLQYRASYPEDPESAPPVSVYDISNYLGLKITGLKNAVPMDVPDSTWFGPYAVRYTEYATTFDTGQYLQKVDKSKIASEEIIQYDTLRDAREAIDLSDGIMNRDGSRRRYGIALLERVMDEDGKPVEPDEFIVLEEDD